MRYATTKAGAKYHGPLHRLAHAPDSELSAFLDSEELHSELRSKDFCTRFFLPAATAHSGSVGLTATPIVGDLEEMIRVRCEALRMASDPVAYYYGHLPE